MWKIVSGIMTIKDKVINQFDSHDADVSAEIGDHGPVSQDAHAAGGEGYVLAHPKGDIKLVPRASFTKANRSIQRQEKTMKMNDILNEVNDNFGLSPEQRKLANMGRTLMNAAATTKDDALSNVMSKVGNELTNFGALFGATNLAELVKKTGVSAEVIKKLMAYADKIGDVHTDLKKDHADSGLDDKDNDDDDFNEPSDADIDRDAVAFAKGQ